MFFLWNGSFLADNVSPSLSVICAGATGKGAVTRSRIQYSQALMTEAIVIQQ